MTTHVMKYTFNAGELSPEFDGRVDHERYYAGVKEMLNYRSLPVGGADRRFGTRYVNAARFPNRTCRLMLFEFNVEQAYVLEVGHQYIRFYRNGARIENPPGTPVEVVSPYLESQLFDIQTAQSADTMWMVHPSHPPHKLLRFSHLTWSLQPIPFDPPPTAQAPDIISIPITLSAVSGNGVTATAAAGFFLDGDVGRQISLVPDQASAARAVIVALGSVAPSTTATINILTPFPSTALAANTWQLDGPIATSLHVSAPGLRSTIIKATLIRKDIQAPELVSDGDFSGGLAEWSDHSGLVLAAGSHTGGMDSSDLQDNAKHFPSLGVIVGMRATNLTKSIAATITAVKSPGNALTTDQDALNNWDTGDAYEISGNGGVEAVNGGAQISGGVGGGTGWIEQEVSTVNGQSYRLLFDLYEGPMSAMVGSGSRLSDLVAEATYEIGLDHEIIFGAISATTFIQFRNNQPTMSKVTDVSVKNVSAAGFRITDVGKFIKVHNGVLEVLGLDNAFSANVLVRSEMDPNEENPDLPPLDAPPGAWTLEVPAWSPGRGFPRAISFHQQRLGFAGTLQQPLTVWQSEVGEFERFGASALADSSLEQEFSANQMNVILWMEPFRDLLVGTATAEHVLRGVNGPLTPTNGEQLPQTRVGSDGVPPLRIDNALILLQRGRRLIKELAIDDVGQAVRGPDHTLIGDHITASGIVQWVMQTKPKAMLWAVRTDGTLIGLTYEQVENVRGWHRHTTQGAFESVCVVPVNAPTDEQTEDVYVSVRRTVNGQTVRYIERFDKTLELDGALSYHGPLADEMSGLDHLEGLAVTVVDKSSGKPAVVPGTFVVTRDEITLPYNVTSADIGLPFTSRLITMRPEIPTRQGSIQGLLKRWRRIRVRLRDSLGLTINGEMIPTRRPVDAMDEGLPVQSQDVELRNFGYDEDGFITIEQTQPLPSTILAVIGDLEVEETA
jgi:hypothetical protein